MRRFYKFFIINLMMILMLFAGLSVQASETDDPAEGGDAAYRYVVKDSLADIYRESSDQLKKDYGQSETQLCSAWLAGILRGDFSPNAVAVFLDHGYFLNYYDQIKDAGVLPEDYVLPDIPYFITPMQERVHIPQEGDVADRYVLITDSTYLQTEQLRAIAEYHGFDEKEVYEQLLESFEEEYIPKSEWPSGTGKAADKPVDEPAGEM